jgi:GT2 family glycosyltransferase
MRTAVVILNWNGVHWLQKFLPSVVERSPEATIVVADNGSQDDSETYTRSQHPEVLWLGMDANRGYAGGYNTALKMLQERHPELEYAVLMNSDIEPLAGWLEPLVTFLDAHPLAGAIQPKLLDFGHPERFEYAGAMGGGMDFWGYPFAQGRVFDHCETDQGQYDQPAFPEVFWASGACLMVRMSAFLRAGQLDTQLFAHMEEIDLCWRMWRAGYTVHAAAPSKVMHVGGGTLGALSPQKTFLNFRNSLLVAVKNLPALAAMRVVAARLFLDGAAGLLFLWRGQGAHCWAIVRAHGQFYRMFARFAFRPQQDAKGWPSAGVYRGSIVWQYYARKKKQIPLS